MLVAELTVGLLLKCFRNKVAELLVDFHGFTSVMISGNGSLRD